MKERASKNHQTDSPTHQVEKAREAGTSILPPAYGIELVDNDGQQMTLSSDSASIFQAAGLHPAGQHAIQGSLTSNAPGSPLPEEVRDKMETAFDADFSDVRVHESEKARSIGALAYTQANHIYFAPGQYRPASKPSQQLIGHELTHVLQQRAGRVKGGRGTGDSINIDRSLESEADMMGARAAQGDSAAVEGTKSGGDAQAQPVIQPALGFELEMAVLVDIDGRPVPEKVMLGTVGQHLELTADQNPQVEGPTPTPASTANYTLPLAGGNEQLGAYDLPAGWQQIAAHIDSAKRVTYYNSQADAYAAHPAPLPQGEQIKPAYRRTADGKRTLQHPKGPGMGADLYASIIEIVTRAYEPETMTGATNILAAMTDAAAFANAINPHINTPLHTINVPGAAVNARSNQINVGNANSPAQTVNASVQTTFGLDIAQLASFIKSTQGFGSQGIFSTKHDSDVMNPLTYSVDYRAKTELPRGISDATEIINAIGHESGSLMWKQSSTLVNARGLIALICQYLRMGKHAYTNGRWVLDKNITPLLSRTDLGDIYNNLPNNEKTWISRHKKEIRREIYARTGRSKHSTVFTDANETQRYTHITVDVQQFINNVLEGNPDGITANLGGFRRIGAEDIDPYGMRPGTEQHKTGPVFELRNMIPADEQVGDRFPPASWVTLARYFIEVLSALNARTDDQARTDTRVRTNVQTGAFIRSDDEPRTW